METLKGYVRYAPEMRFTVNGKAITTFTIYDTPSTTDKFKLKSKIVTWEELAEKCNWLIQLDEEIYVKGYWKTRSWQNRDNKTITTKEFTAAQIWLSRNNKPIDIMSVVEEE